jgi:hypothetical protein
MRLSYKLTVRVALALALLFAQAGALSHLYSHQTAKYDPAGLAGGQGQVCSDCLSLAPLLATAGGTDTTFALCAPDADRAIGFDAHWTIIPARHYAFRSRAPPQSLLIA